MAEFQAKEPQSTDDQLRKLFDFFDEDGDGFIDQDEMLLGTDLDSDRSAHIVREMLGTLPPLDKPHIDFRSFSKPPLASNPVGYWIHTQCCCVPSGYFLKGAVRMV